VLPYFKHQRCYQIEPHSVPDSSELVTVAPAAVLWWPDHSLCHCSGYDDSNARETRKLCQLIKSHTFFGIIQEVYQFQHAVSLHIFNADYFKTFVFTISLQITRGDLVTKAKLFRVFVRKWPNIFICEGLHNKAIHAEQLHTCPSLLVSKGNVH
jgi:hypothetical protein